MKTFYKGKASKEPKNAEQMFYRSVFSIGNMSESQSQSIGMNFSVGIGGVTGSSDLYAAKTLKFGANGTIGITYNSTTSNTEKMMMDINGDGLQDILEMSAGNSVISVRYNTGCGFTSKQTIELPGWKNFVKDNFEKFLTQADSNGFDLGLIKDIPVIGAAASKGLTSVSINPFGFNAENFSNSLDWNTSVTLGMSGSVGANVNIGIDIIILCVYCGTINIAVSGGAGSIHPRTRRALADHRPSGGERILSNHRRRAPLESRAPRGTG